MKKVTAMLFSMAVGLNAVSMAAKAKASEEQETDVLLIGGGIMSATLGTYLRELEPEWSMTMVERLEGVAQESSNGCGMNGAGQPWRVAIQKPTDKENAVQAVVDINGHGISTSGSYRNYYELDGKRLSHVIDPQTGRPIEHNLVSVTVIAPTALVADAWDTGLMVLGPEKATEVVRREGLAVYMITKEGDSFKTWMSPQFKSFLISEKN
jgi:hypothetical protein